MQKPDVELKMTILVATVYRRMQMDAHPNFKYSIWINPLKMSFFFSFCEDRARAQYMAYMSSVRVPTAHLFDLLLFLVPFPIQW
jgi:hypothetical protein